MPPSPSLRFSPSRELRGENHKRGRSFESGLLFKEKDDDPALFNKMRNKESDDFLLQSSDDFEDTISKQLKHFSDYKLGINVHVRGESSELFDAVEDKNDYDWLLTPPDTPLFPSLDDEPSTNAAARRGRPRSQPISISRSSTLEKSHRNSRGSPSPNRLSPSPRSGVSALQSRGRPSGSHSSPSPGHRPASPIRKSSPPASPIRKSSPPPSKPSTPAPTSRRMSTGSTTVVSLGMRGTSPVRTSRGNSSSPKVMAWQSNIPGFSLDAPPNLRTSLADRPASYVRGSSPASRNSRDSATRGSRQSMSPTATRSVSSSHSHERDPFSSHSKGSVASSGDDDIDSLQFTPLGDHAITKRVSAFPNNKSPTFSKKSLTRLSPSSAPKRSFDSAIRQMDHRKAPQNMFRPLLSSVPSTTFYVGKSGSSHHADISKDSYITTSSNASSEQGLCFQLDTEGSDHHQDDVAELKKVSYPPGQEEVFAFDKVDEFINDGTHSSLFNVRPDDDVTCDSSKECNHCITDVEVGSPSDILHSNLENIEICSKCGYQYRVTEPIKEGNVCPSCMDRHDLLTVNVPDSTMVATDTPLQLSVKTGDENNVSDEVESSVRLPDSSIKASNEAGLCKENIKEGDLFSEQKRSLLRETSVTSSLIDEPIVDQNLVRSQEVMHSNSDSDTKADYSEGAGITVLLKRSSSSKGPVFQGRTFIAAAKPYEDLTYARNSGNSFTSFTGHGSSSTSSSIDYGRVQRQLSGKKSDLENYRYDMALKSQSSISSLSGVSSHAFQGSSIETTAPEQYCDIIPVMNPVCADVDGVTDLHKSTGSVETSTSVLSSHTVSIDLDDNLISSLQNSEDTVALENVEGASNYARIVSNGEATPSTTESCLEEEARLRTGLDEAEGAELPSHSCFTTISEIEIENSSFSQTDYHSPYSKNNSNEFQEPSSFDSSAKDMVASVTEPNNADQEHVISDEPTMLVECHKGSKGRSLTLEEATDTILFCSSIVHDLAYRAATLAIEKENEVPLQSSRPTVTILGKSNTGGKDPRGRNVVSKRPSRSVKSYQKHVETDEKPPQNKIENDENADESTICGVGVPNKVDNMKPPPKLESKCNCSIM